MAEATNKFRHSGFTTRSSHLRRLKNGEDEAWREFYRKYRAMILAIGKGAETIRLTEIREGESHRYYRENGVHCVPKRSLDDLVI